MNLRWRVSVWIVMGMSAVSGVGMAQPTFSGSALSQPYCDESPSMCNQVASFTVSITSVPTNPAGNAVLTLTSEGDHNGGSESFNVSIEGFDLGVFLDSNPDNDSFDNASFSDIGNTCGASNAAPATIPLANLQSIVADGEIEITFSSSSANISDFCDDPQEFLQVEVLFDLQEQVPAVPPWAALLLIILLAAIGGFLSRRRMNMHS